MLSSQLLGSLRQEGVVIFAGAGLSRAAPSCLPDWHRLNQLVFDCLCDRYEEFFDKPDSLMPVRAHVDNSRQKGDFPPDYQAQLLHEHCGDDYFRLLQCVDACVINANHEALASFVAKGNVKAIVTSNFDRLIERALEAQGIPFNVAFDADSYESCFARLNSTNADQCIDVIKIHGCVHNHLTLIDTLKQRLHGRNRYLEEALSLLLKRYYFIYTGFSASDLESDRDYLGLLGAVSDSPGLVYCMWPGDPELSKGAVMLLSAYDGRAHTVMVESQELFYTLANGHGESISKPMPIISSNGDGRARVERSLANASQHLSDSMVSTCVAAVLDANGRTQEAYDMLHTFWCRTLSPERLESGFVRFRLLYGRLGIGLGQISAKSHATSAQLELGIENLIRVRELDRRADAWAGLALVWYGRIKQGYQLILSSLNVPSKPGDLLEHQLDCWFALAEYRFFSDEGVDAFEGWPRMLALAQSCDDLARMARVAAMVYLHLCYARDDKANADQMYHQVLLPHVFRRSDRLNDPVSEGLLALARGRWFKQQSDTESASLEIQKAMQNFMRAGMVRWYDFARIELCECVMDKGRVGEAAQMLDALESSLVDHVLLWPRYHAARAALHGMTGDSQGAVLDLNAAAQSCSRLGMVRWQANYEHAAEQACAV